MAKVWSREKAKKWEDSQPWFFGANFVPSNASNQLEMWQEETFSPDLIEKELGFAKGIGMNIMRVFLHDILWKHNPEALFRNMDRYLEIADQNGIKTMFVFFDDCWNQSPQPGPQPAPLPYTHNSRWLQSPGRAIVNDKTRWQPLKEYVTETLKRYKDDERIAMWDLYNEPGNDHAGNRQETKSLPLLKKIFEWTRAINPHQPLTAGIWAFEENFKPLNEFQIENSDIITFHNYNKPNMLEERLMSLPLNDRPVICTEYMARTTGSTFAKCLPILKKHNVGAINWGLVSGKTQTIYPWRWSKDKGEPEQFFHDIFNADGSLLYPEEKSVFDSITDG